MTGPMGSLWLRVLPPPYAAFQPPNTSDFPLGAVLVCEVCGGRAALQAAADRTRRAPWVPVLLVGANLPAEPSFIDALLRVPARLAWLPIELAALHPEDVRRAMVKRPPPTVEQLSRYVAERLGEPRLLSLLSAALDGASLGGGGVPGPCRTVRCAGSCTALAPSARGTGARWPVWWGSDSEPAAPEWTWPATPASTPGPFGTGSAACLASARTSIANESAGMGMDPGDGPSTPRVSSCPGAGPTAGLSGPGRPALAVGR